MRQLYAPAPIPQGTLPFEGGVSVLQRANLAGGDRNAQRQIKRDRDASANARNGSGTALKEPGDGERPNLPKSATLPASRKSSWPRKEHARHTRLDTTFDLRGLYAPKRRRKEEGSGWKERWREYAEGEQTMGQERHHDNVGIANKRIAR
ncbi:hypothetical protein MTO96_009067 [Rhipicephalus appendiculatus]